MSTNKLKKLSICTRYGRLGASSRVRYFLYEDTFRQYGWEPHYHGLLPDAYLKRLYRRQTVFWLGLFGLLRRLLTAVFYGDRLLIEYELLPFLPWALEKLYLRCRRYVLNFDDDVWEKYRGRRLLENKFDQLIRHAAGVIAANDLLYEKIAPLNCNTIKIPSVIDLDAYRARSEKFARFTVVWIGTAITFRECLKPMAAGLAQAAERTDFQLLIIADTDLEELPGVPCRFVKWDGRNEATLLSQAHVGIMPLPDLQFMRGKSAYKLIQYLGAGIPAIASPVGENRRLAEQADGAIILADTPEQWAEEIFRLASDEKLRRRLELRAQAVAYNWSLQKYAPIMGDFLRKCFRD